MPNNNGGNNGHGLKATRVNRPLINENDIIQKHTWAESDHSSPQSKRYREAFPDIDHPVVQLVRSTVVGNQRRGTIKRLAKKQINKYIFSINNFEPSRLNYIVNIYYCKDVLTL